LSYPSMLSRFSHQLGTRSADRSLGANEPLAGRHQHVA